VVIARPLDNSYLAHACMPPNIKIPNENTDLFLLLQVRCGRCSTPGVLSLSSDAVADGAPYQASSECPACRIAWHASMRTKFVHDTNNVSGSAVVGCPHKSVHVKQHLSQHTAHRNYTLQFIVGLARAVYILYMAVYLVISLPKIPYIHRIYMVLANFSLLSCRAAGFRARQVCARPKQREWVAGGGRSDRSPTLPQMPQGTQHKMIRDRYSQCMYTVYIYIVYGRIFGGFHDKSTVYTPYIHT